METKRVIACAKLRGSEVMADVGDEFDCPAHLVPVYLDAGVIEMPRVVERAVAEPAERAVVEPPPAAEPPKAKPPAKKRAKKKATR